MSMRRINRRLIEGLYCLFLEAGILYCIASRSAFWIDRVVVRIAC
jgi:hypothetical protein